MQASAYLGAHEMEGCQIIQDVLAQPDVILLSMEWLYGSEAEGSSVRSGCTQAVALARLDLSCGAQANKEQRVSLCRET